MRNKVIFLALVVISSIKAANSEQEAERLMHNAMHRNTLNLFGLNAKVCLKIMKQRIKLTDEQQKDIQIAIKAYLDALDEFNIFIGAKDRKSPKVLANI